MKYKKIICLLICLSMLFGTSAALAEIETGEETAVPTETAAPEENESENSAEATASAEPGSDSQEEETEQPETDDQDDSAEHKEEASVAEIDPDERAEIEKSMSLMMSEDDYFQQTIDQYAEFDFSDPQNRIAETGNASAKQKALTDEKFFGRWNDASQNWEIEPLLDYSFAEYEWPSEESGKLEPLTLTDIEDAAKTGSYDAAKEALLSYYRKVFSLQDRSDVSSWTNKRQLLTAQASFENLGRSKDSSANAVEKLTLTGEDQTFEIDVLTDVKSVQSSVNKKFGYLMTALKKDGYMGVFYSKENEDHKPYLKVTVNGNVRTYEPIADNYIQAGSANSSKNYGSSNLLYAEESYSSIGNAYSVDDYTKRPYFGFDLSDIDSGDTVSDARLYVTGHMEESDNPKRPEVMDKTEKVIFVWKSLVSSWSESSFTWRNCSEHDVFSYDGEMGNNFKTPIGGPSGTQAIQSTLDNATKFTSFISTLAWAYKGTHEEAYAYHAIRMLMNAVIKYAERDPNNPTDTSSYHSTQYRDFHNTGQRAKALPDLLSCVVDSEYMTPEIFTALLKHSYFMCNDLVNGWGTAQEGNNIGSLQIEGLCETAVTFREFKKYYAPLDNNGEPANSSAPGSFRGGWNEVLKARMNYKVKNDLFSDGSSIEVGMGYSDLNAQTFVNCIFAATAAGTDGSTLMSEEGMEYVEKYVLYLMNASTPTYGDWQQGHAYGHGSNYLQGTRGPKYLKILSNPYIRWASSGGSEGVAPEYTSVTYNVGMKAILRSAWDKYAVALQTNADGGQKSHGQNDDLGINVYAYGQHFLVDPLYHNYDSGHAMNIFLNSTRAHNTIEINNVSQKGGASSSGKDPNGNQIITKGGGQRGSMHENNQELNNMYDFVRAETVNYKGNSDAKDDFEEYREILFIRPDYFIVTDYIKPSDTSKVNRYAQNWHFLPGLNPTLDEDTRAIKTNNDGANLQIVPVNTAADQNYTTVENLDGFYAVSAGNEMENPYHAIVKNKAGITTFNTVLYPTTAGDNTTVTTEEIALDCSDSEASAFHINITDTKGQTKTAAYYTVFGDNKPSMRNFSSYETDGSNLYVEPGSQSGRYTSIILRNGTEFKDNALGKTVVKSTKQIKDAGLTWVGSKIKISSADITEGNIDEAFDTFTIYAPSGNETVVVNDKTVKMKRNGDYLYYGSESAVGEPGPSSTPTVKPTQKPGGGGGGSHGSGGINQGATAVPSLVPSPTPETEPTNAPESSKFEEELKGHWGEKEISSMVDDGFVEGVSDTSLGLQNETTRAEFITMLVRAMDMELIDYEPLFNDVASNDWYAAYMITAQKNGLIEGSEGNAYPDRTITREEMAKILVRAYQIQTGNDVEGIKIHYTDDDKISPWAVESIEKVTALGLMNGISETVFAPQAFAKREQAIVVVYRLRQLK